MSAGAPRLSAWKAALVLAVAAAIIYVAIVALAVVAIATLAAASFWLGAKVVDWTSARLGTEARP